MYESLIAEIVKDHRKEIEEDLAAARARVSDLDAELTESQWRVAVLEGLLAMSPGRAPERAERVTMTLHDAMAKVLSTAPDRMMRAGDLARAIDQRGLYRMRDGRSVEATQIHARVGHNPHLFAKEGTLIKLI